MAGDSVPGCWKLGAESSVYGAGSPAGSNPPQPLSPHPSPSLGIRLGHVDLVVEADQSQEQPDALLGALGPPHALLPLLWTHSNQPSGGQ